MKPITALLLSVAALISPVLAQESPIADVKFEMRLAVETPGEGLIEAQVKGKTDRTIYLYKSSVLDSTDVLSAKVTEKDHGLQIMVEFSEEGGEKMFDATSNGTGKLLAIVVDGQVIFAPIIRSAVSSSAAISGDFSKPEAERIASLIQGGNPNGSAASPIAGTTFEMRLAWEKPGPERIEVVVGDNQRKLYLDKVLLNQSHVRDAVADMQNGDAVINVEFLQSGSALLGEATKVGAKSQAYLAVIVDGRVIFAPQILEPISSPAMITGDFSMDEAKRLAAVIRGPRPSASLLLIKTDWSLAKDPDQVAKDVRLLLTREGVDPGMLEQLPKTAGGLVLFNELSSTYTPQQFSQLLTWLTAQKLIEKTIPLSDFVKRDTADDHASVYSLRSSRRPEDLGFTSLNQFASKSLLSEIRPEFDWEVWLTYSDNGVSWTYRNDLLQKEVFRGQSEAKRRDIFAGHRGEGLSGLGTCCIFNAFPDSSPLQSAVEQMGYEVLVALEFAPDQRAADPKAVLHLPQSVDGSKFRSTMSKKFGDHLRSLAANQFADSVTGTPETVPSKSNIQLLNFTAAYCQPCQEMAPILKSMQRDQYPVKVVDITADSQLARQYNIDRIPTCVLLVNGIETARTVGIVEEGELRNMINQAARRAESGTQDTTSEVIATNIKEDLERLQAEYNARQEELNSLVAAIKDEDSVPQKKLQLVQYAVSALFDLRQELRHAELTQMEAQIRESRRTLAAQAKSKDSSVAKRVREQLAFLSRDGSSELSPTFSPRKINLLVQQKQFETGEDNCLSIKFDDIDLLKVLNMDPVPIDAVKYFPEWLKQLDGKRVRIRGFMYPTFESVGIKEFTLTTSRSICNFVRQPKVYECVSVKLNRGNTTFYEEGHVEVEGIFKIKPDGDGDGLWRLFEIADARIVNEQRKVRVIR